MTKAKKAPAVNAPSPKTAAAPSATAPQAEGGKIGKAIMVDQLATKSGLSKAEAGAVFDAVVEIVVDALKAGQVVGLPGLGTFSVRQTAARQGVNPSTGEKMPIPAGKKVGYKVATDLKKAL